ncbi:hypothetical protein A6R68_01342, partial [Neotoma lepida]
DYRNLELVPSRPQILLELVMRDDQEMNHALAFSPPASILSLVFLTASGSINTMCISRLKKPGACPKPSATGFGISVERCSGDESCPKQTKHCSN